MFCLHLLPFWWIKLNIYNSIFSSIFSCMYKCAEAVITRISELSSCVVFTCHYYVHRHVTYIRLLLDDEIPDNSFMRGRRLLSLPMWRRISSSVSGSDERPPRLPVCITRWAKFLWLPELDAWRRLSDHANTTTVFRVTLTSAHPNHFTKRQHYSCLKKSLITILSVRPSRSLIGLELHNRHFLLSVLFL